jgi:hypothetical protein
MVEPAGVIGRADIASAAGLIDVRAGAHQELEYGSVPWLVEVHVPHGGLGEHRRSRWLRNRVTT